MSSQRAPRKVRLGRTLHLSPVSHNLIVRTNLEVKLGAPVFDRSSRLIGRVVDVFGPVSKPFVAIKPDVSDPKRYVGRVVYVERTG